VHILLGLSVCYHDAIPVEVFFPFNILTVNTTAVVIN